MKIVSWNVNGVRACARKGFSDWLGDCGADVVALQETKCHREQLAEELASPAGWHAHWLCGERRGYSGVALLARSEPDDVVDGMGLPEYDREGRVLMARFGRLCVLSVYVPNGGRDASRIPYKLDFSEALREHCDRLRRGGRRVVVAGDWNTAHQAIDLARPKENVETSGFRPEEREAHGRWIEAGWIDSFRHLHPDVEGAYSWWTYRAGARERNVGWRIDACLISPSLEKRLVAATIHPEVHGSDHCPVGVELDV